MAATGCLKVLPLSVFFFSAWLIFGRYGNVKLGAKEDKPEFSTFTWIAMFFVPVLAREQFIGHV